MLIAGVSACTNDDSTGPAGSSTVTSMLASIENPEPSWSGVKGDVQLGTLELSASPDGPQVPPTRIALARRVAVDGARRVGTLLVSPGGPGLSGVDVVKTAQLYIPQEIRDRFDIVSWDPRGVGETKPEVDCIDNYDAVFEGLDTTPSDRPAEQRLMDAGQTFVDGCEQHTGDAIQHVGTNQAARDIDAIRRALGEEKISYLGFSYGAELGAVWASMYPDTVRAAVLDGAVDPTADGAERRRQQAAGFEQAIDTYLARCSSDPHCAFSNGGEAQSAFDQLLARLDEQPIPSSPRRPDVTREIALEAVAEAMYSDGLWDQLSGALAAAQGGDGAGLLQLWDAYWLRQPDGTWPNTREAGAVITCMDQAERPTLAEDDASMARTVTESPRAAPGLVDTHLCSLFPKSDDPRIAITGNGAGPILVIGTTGDPATPYAGSKKMAATLHDGHLLTVEAKRHTGYGANQCAQDVVDRYLIDLEVPADGTTC